MDSLSSAFHVGLELGGEGGGEQAITCFPLAVRTALLTYETSGH